MVRIRLLNSYVDNLTMKTTLAKVEGIIKEGIPTQHVAINASKINLMRQDAKLAEIVNRSPLINADGSSIVLAGKLLGKPLLERVTGIDLFMNVLALCQEKGYRPFFLGATQEVVETMIAMIQQTHSLEIAGYHNGYFDQQQSATIVQEIASTNADVLFVAFSSPQKEYWINQHLTDLNVPFVMGVGGSFDVLAGKTKRAPQVWQIAGMEWAYRFIQEPRRLARRYLIGNVSFLLYVLKEKMSRSELMR